MRCYCLTLGFFLLTVRAETDVQGYHTARTKGTTVTTYLLLKKENTVGHGTEVIPTETTHGNTAVSATFPGVVLFDNIPTSPHERIQITKTLAVIASPSRDHFALRNGQNSPTSLRHNPTAMRIHTESEIPLISNYEKIVFSSTQAAFESMSNGTSEPEVHLSANAVKSSLLLHTLHNNKNQRSSFPLVSADRESGVSVLSAAHPRVIDNLAMLHNNGDKRSQGKDEKGISNLGTNTYQLSEMQSVSQNDTAENSLGGESVTKSCLTCLRDGRTVSTGESVARPALLLESSPRTVSIKGLALDFNESSASSPTLHQQSAGEHDLNKNKSERHLEKWVNTGDPLSKLYFSNITKSAFHSLSTNFKNIFMKNHPLVVSSGSVSNTPVITETAHSSQKSVPASNATARLRLIEAHSTVEPFSFGRQTTSALKHTEFHSLTERADSLIPAPRRQTPAESSSQTKEPMLSLLPKGSAIKVKSVSTETHLADTDNSQTAAHPSQPANEGVLQNPQIPSVTTSAFVLPVTLLLSGSRPEFVKDVSTLKLTSGKLSAERLTTIRPGGTQSKITPKVTLDGTTHQPFTTYNRDFIRKLQIAHNLKLEDKDEQVLTVAAEDQDKEIIKREDEGIKETKEIVKLHKDDKSKEGEASQNKREELYKSHKIESGNPENTINTGLEINHITYMEGEKGDEHRAEKSQEDGEVSIEEEDVTLRQDKDPRQEEARGKEDVERTGVTKTNTEHFTKVAAKQRESLTRKGTEAGTEEMANLKNNRETGGENVTNVPLGATADTEELNRDKGHTVIEPFSCHTLIKQLGATEQKGIYLGENTAQNNNKNKSFSYRVFSRLLNSTLRPLSPKLSRATSLPKEPHTQNNQSTLQAPPTKRATTSSPIAQSAAKQFKATNSATATPKTVSKHTSGVSASNFSDTVKPTVPPQSSATKSAHAVLRSISETLSLTAPQFAVTAGVPRAQPHFTLNSPPLTLSVIYSVANQRHEISSVSNANSLLQTTNKGRRVKHILKARFYFKSRVKEPLTSNMIENMSTSVHPALPLQTYNDSSTGSPTAETLSSEAHVSDSLLQSHQGQFACQKSQSSSSSSDMTSGQRCSFKLSEETVHSDVSRGPVDDNGMRSVQNRMASMSPEAKSDQFPLNNMSLVRNAKLLGGDTLPGTYSLTEITRSDSEKETLRVGLKDEYANSGSGHAEHLLDTTDEPNQSGENDAVQTIVPSAAKTQTDAETNRMLQNSDGKNSSDFMAQTVGRSEHPANGTDEFSFRSKLQTEKLAVKSTNDNDNNHLFSVDGNNEANKIAKSTLDENHLSQLDGYKGASTKPIVDTIQATHKTEQAINQDVLPVTNDFPATGSTAFVESYNRPENPKMQTNDVTNGAISDMEHHPTGAIDKQQDSSKPPPGAVSGAHIYFRSDLKVLNAPTQQIDSQIMNGTTTTAKTNDFATPATNISSTIVSTDAYESMLTTSESTQVVIEKAEHAAGTAQTDSLIVSLSQRDPTPGKYIPAVKRKHATESQNVELPEYKVSGRGLDLGHRATPGMMITARPINDPDHTALLNDTHKAGGTPEITAKQVEFKDIKTAQKTKTFLNERTSAERRQDRAQRHQYYQTSISQVILGAMAESVPPTGALPTESVNKANCSTIGCAKSGKTTKTTSGADKMDRAAEKEMHEKQAGRSGKDTTAETGNRSTDSPVPGKARQQAANMDPSALSPATSSSDGDQAAAEESVTKNANSVTYEPLTKTLRAAVERDDSERPETHEQDQFVEKTTQGHAHRETTEDQEAVATEVISSEPGATTAQTNKQSTGWNTHTERNTSTQSYRGAGQNEKSEAQNTSSTLHDAAKDESGRRLLLLEPELESNLPRLNHRRRTSPHLYLSGVTEVSEDLCGSGNYTAEMSLNLGRGVEPGDAVPALGSLRVVINLKTNNSRVNLEVTSCCLSPTIQPDLTNSTCCLFSRLAAEPVGITLLPSALSTSASFTISLFQMINYSVVYLHCDLSVCLRNRSDCERECLQQRNALPLESPEAIVTNLRNRISFGPMLKEAKNSTFPEAIDPPELDLVLIVVSLVVGSSLVTVMLLLVWLAYRRRAIWPLHLAAPPRACCGCMRPRGDLILP